MTSPLLLTRSVLRNERIFLYEYLKMLEQTLSLNNPISRNLQNFFWARSKYVPAVCCIKITKFDTGKKEKKKKLLISWVDSSYTITQYGNNLLVTGGYEIYRAPKRTTQKKGGLRHEQVRPYRCVWIDYCYRFSFYFCWVWKRRENDSPEKVYGWLWTRIWRCFKVLHLNEKFSLNWHFINTNFKSAQVRRNLHPVEFDFNRDPKKKKSSKKLYDIWRTKIV